ncbi:GNAT family N-acetyltransferase [Leptolyngbya sp. FACHB-261]|uniref:GNAT family N-acetyltransferase n=1 Tax=Leptolyngbya sp. FACHB-261 TaxID=2692806 RepID=UPI0016893B82|nr:GNAT family N-acetyltransferase [Leptolyngbya sp. FACHB-261]MBD2102547.1 GNAT family N-acetyltransferase [Leptolyngbya sp. FACHB-261]
MEIHFKEATSTDLNVLMQYMQEFHEFDHTEPFDKIPARAAIEQVVTDKFIGRVWLIQQAEDVVGYIVLTLGYRLEYRGYYAFLDELYVRLDKRGQGIGTKAVQFLEQACQQLGVQILQLEVKQDNQTADALYKKIGFEQQERYVLIKKI